LHNGVNNSDLLGANSPNCKNPDSTIFDDVQLANMDGTMVKANFPGRQVLAGTDSSADLISAGKDSPIGSVSVRVPAPVRAAAQITPSCV
jgi:hypothetical protein